MNNLTNEERKDLIDAFVATNNIKRYRHGERPEGENPVIPSAWSRSKSKAVKEIEEQAVLDAIA